jgi:SnoaL-like polyketide cyclase
MSADEKNMELMKTLDDAWNSQDWIEIPSKNVMQNDVAIFWPGQPDLTRAVHNHRKESVEFFKTFPDNHLVNNPYKILFSKDDYTCSVADFTGTFKGPMKGLDGKIIQPTNEKFHIEFCTIAHWKDEKILEERLFYDLVGMLAQIGVMPSST